MLQPAAITPATQSDFVISLPQDSFTVSFELLSAGAGEAGRETGAAVPWSGDGGLVTTRLGPKNPSHPSGSLERRPVSLNINNEMWE
jgi:hypothetical protein